MQRGEVWWVEFDPAVGSEVRKTRPAVIVSNDAANRNLTRVVVVPVTSNTGRQYPGEALITVAGQSSKAMADQIMAADKSRGGFKPEVQHSSTGVDCTNGNNLSTLTTRRAHHASELESAGL